MTPFNSVDKVYKPGGEQNFLLPSPSPSCSNFKEFKQIQKIPCTLLSCLHLKQTCPPFIWTRGLSVPWAAHQALHHLVLSYPNHLPEALPATFRPTGRVPLHLTGLQDITFIITRLLHSMNVPIPHLPILHPSQSLPQRSVHSPQDPCALLLFRQRTQGICILVINAEDTCHPIHPKSGFSEFGRPVG